MDGHLDDYDFSPSANSNLASLFGISPVDQANTSLTYTAPKQPRPTTLETSANNTETPKPTSSTVAAQVVSVWKLVSNKYESIGKLGLALIESSIQNVQEIILYKDKRNVISRAKICNAFVFTHSPDNFASFYDHEKQCWLIKFNAEGDLLLIGDEIEKRGGKVVQNTPKRDKKNEDITDNQKPEDESEIKIGTSHHVHENHKKPDIISRISKMGGQSILPKIQQARSHQSTDISDSEDDSFRFNPPHFKSSPKKEEVITKQLEPQTNIVQIPQNHIQNTFPGSFIMGQYDPMNAFLSENRNHNTEMSINLSQITEKLNHVLRVVENTNNTSNNDSISQEDLVSLKSRNKVLELKIDNLSRENEENKRKFDKLQQEFNEVSGSSKFIEEQNLNLLKQSFLEKENVYTSEINHRKKCEKVLNETVSRQNVELEELGLEMQKSDDDKDNLKKQIEELKTTVQELQAKASIAKPERSGLNEGEFVEYMKETMNSMYGSIMDNFEEEQKYSHSHIHSIIAKNIKTTTRKIIQSFQDACSK